MVTYTGQSPAEIRTGDKVMDALGREFIAYSDAELSMGDYCVNGVLMHDEGIRSFILDVDSVVTISYDESAWNMDEF
jgi:hypothetical protein